MELENVVSRGKLASAVTRQRQLAQKNLPAAKVMPGVTNESKMSCNRHAILALLAGGLAIDDQERQAIIKGSVPAAKPRRRATLAR